MNISAAERSDAMKTYRPTAELLEDVRDVFASNRPCSTRSPLDEVVELVQRADTMGGRVSTWL